MSFIARNKLLSLVVLYLVVILIAIPLALVNLKKTTQITSNATASTILSFSPASVQKNTGETVPIDIMIDPGNNAVSFITLDILYDVTKLTLDTIGFQTNPNTFPAIIEGPVFDTGRMRVKVSIGADPTRAITAPTKVGTLTFKAVAATNGTATEIKYGNASYVLSVGANDNATDNVLASVQTASVQIGGLDLPTPTGVGGPINSPIPTFGGPSPTVITQLPTNTPVPTQICTPVPHECEDEEGDTCQVPAGNWCTAEPSPTLGNGEPTPTQIPVACQKADTTDVVLVLDKSSSMKGEKIANAKESAKNFVKVLSQDAKNTVGLVTFAKDASVVAPLSNSASPVENAIDSITLSDSTCIKCGIDAADTELSTHGRPGAKKVVVLITDGRANTGGGTGADKQITAEQAAINQLKNAKTSGLVMYTIGIGTDVNPSFLQQLATLSNGAYYFAASPVHLDDTFIAIYKNISDALCNVQPIPGTSISLAPPQQDSSFNSVTLIMILLLILPLLLLFGHLLF